MIQISNKRYLLVLSSVTFLFLSFIGIVIYLAFSRMLEGIHPLLPNLLILILGGILGFAAFNLFSLAAVVIRGKGIANVEGFRKAFFKFFYPLLVFTGKIFRLSNEKIQLTFIDVNNLLIRSNPRHVRPEKILVLLPHCLQFNECDIRITGDVYRCIGCGRCEIKDLVEMAGKANIQLSVATGGGLARRLVDEKKPEAIIAVACENDLSSGIIDTYPLPVLGVINQRPYGPCLNTLVDLEKVKDALRYFTGL